MSDLEEVNAEEIKEYIKRNGVSGIDEFSKMQLERWKKVTVNIGITGRSGVGKSSFINAIRGLLDDDDGAAEVGVTECTTEPTPYDHRKYPNVKFWDLPGIGTPTYPDLKTYRQKAQLTKYHTFLILTSVRFEENDIKLAKEIKEQGKSFFFIRTKIDVDVKSGERKKSFSETAMLQEIRSNCVKHLVDKNRKSICSKEDIFLISNHHSDKWDFSRLTEAILDALPRYEREALTLCLNALTGLSKNLLERKVKILKGRIFLVAGMSAAVALAPVPGLSIAVDALIMFNEVREYITQLGIPVQGSTIFNFLSSTTQRSVVATQVQFSSVPKILALFAKEAGAGLGVEEASRYIPFVGPAIASAVSFGCTIFFLRKCLNEIEEVALAVLEEAKQQSIDSVEHA